MDNGSTPKMLELFSVMAQYLRAQYFYHISSNNHLHPATFNATFEHGFLIAFNMNRLGD